MSWKYHSLVMEISLPIWSESSRSPLVLEHLKLHLTAIPIQFQLYCSRRTGRDCEVVVLLDVWFAAEAVHQPCAILCTNHLGNIHSTGCFHCPNKVIQAVDPSSPHLLLKQAKAPVGRKFVVADKLK